jgi:hypothetical protein
MPQTVWVQFWNRSQDKDQRLLLILSEDKAKRVFNPIVEQKFHAWLIKLNQIGYSAGWLL